jgi:hypothetical protein
LVMIFLIPSQRSCSKNAVWRENWETIRSFLSAKPRSSIAVYWRLWCSYGGSFIIAGS